MEGVDYSWGRPPPAELHALGVRFVCRYLAYQPSGKVLSTLERADLHAAGLAIVLNWEHRAGDMLGGYGVGLKHAQEALRQADALGAPHTVPIYFSCDFDADPAEYPTVRRYLDGAATVLGRHRVGVYGKADVIDAMVPGTAAWGWQTYAWSGGRVSDQAHLLQYRNLVTLAGAAVDLDRTLKAAFGAWEPGMVWYKAAWINPFFAALSVVAPLRERGGDGTIGDLAHASGSSGHNPDDTPGVTAERTDADTKPEVRAADASSNLRAGAIGMQQVVDAILAHPPDRNRLIYIIFNGYIWSANNGWKRATYAGTDKHRTHVHLSGNPASDDDDRPWNSILNLGADMAALDTSDPSYNDLIFSVAAVVDNSPTVTGGPDKGKPNGLYAALAGLRAETAAMRTILETVLAQGGNVDTAAILEAMDAKLEELAKEQRDAVADLGEGGAAQVRADA